MCNHVYIQHYALLTTSSTLPRSPLSSYGLTTTPRTPSADVAAGRSILESRRSSMQPDEASEGKGAPSRAAAGLGTPSLYAYGVHRRRRRQLGVGRPSGHDKSRAFSPPQGHRRRRPFVHRAIAPDSPESKPTMRSPTRRCWLCRLLYLASPARQPRSFSTPKGGDATRRKKDRFAHQRNRHNLDRNTVNTVRLVWAPGASEAAQDEASGTKRSLEPR